MKIKLDSEQSCPCDYCGAIVSDYQAKVIVGAGQLVRVYHRDCYALDKAEWVNSYLVSLRALDPGRKEII